MDKLLNPDTGLIIWTIVTFLCLVFILKAAARGPLLHAIEDRENRIKAVKEGAERARAEAERIQKELMAQMDGVHAKSRELLVLSLVFGLVAAALYLLRPSATSGGKWAIIKTIPVAFFALIAWQQSAPIVLVVALALSAVGDCLLAHEGERFFLGGLAAFFFAHFAYILLFASGGTLLLANEPWRIAVALVFLVHAALMARRLASGR